MENLPPHDEDAEAAVLGAMLVDARLAKIGAALLTPKDFYVPRHEHLFRFFCEQFRLHRKLDPLALKHEATKQRILTKCGGGPIFSRLLESCLDASNIERYARIVREYSLRRQAMREAQEALRLAESGEMGLPEACPSKGLAQVEADIDAEIEGRRRNLDFPGFEELNRTKAGLPGTITVLCGSPGASKSLFLVQMLTEWFKTDHLVTCLMLESGIKMHTRRVIAQLRESSKITDDAWVRDHEEDVIGHLDAVREFMSRFESNRVLQALPRGQRPTIDYLIDWVRRQAEEGYRFIAVDPITKASTDGRVSSDHDRFLEQVETIVADTGSTFLFVTHPRDGQGERIRPSLDNMAGGKGLGRFCDAGFWIEAHDWTNSEVTKALCPKAEFLKHNRTIHCTKARNGVGEKYRYAAVFEVNSLRHKELGRIV